MGEIIGAVVAVVAVLVFVGAVANSKRSTEIRELAAKNQWDKQDRDRDLPNTFGGRPFQEGHGRVATNVLRGQHSDRTVLVFDYVYKTSGSEGDDVHRHWVACVEGLPAALPPLEIVQRKWTKGNVSRLGGVEVPVGDRAFDDRYRVTTTSRQLVVDVLTPDIVRLLMAWPDFPWRVEGTRLLTWGKGAMDPHWVEPVLNMLTTLAGAIPQDVWRSAG